MKLSNETIINSINQLRGVAQKQLPIKASYAIAKNIGKLENEFKTYDKERAKLIDKYAEKDTEGNIVSYENGNIKIKDEHIKEWNKDINELLSIENEVAIHKFPLSALNGYDLSAAEIMVIEYMLEE